MFHSLTTDPATGRADEVSEVVFRDGRAVRVKIFQTKAAALEALGLAD